MVGWILCPAILLHWNNLPSMWFIYNIAFLTPIETNWLLPFWSIFHQVSFVLKHTSLYLCQLNAILSLEWFRKIHSRAFWIVLTGVSWYKVSTAPLGLAISAFWMKAFISHLYSPSISYRSYSTTDPHGLELDM